MVPIMWNFTVRAIMKPNLKECETLWKDPATATQSQGTLANLQVHHLFLGKITY
jgi:hypothetical protein